MKYSSRTEPSHTCIGLNTVSSLSRVESEPRSIPLRLGKRTYRIYFGRQRFFLETATVPTKSGYTPANLKRAAKTTEGFGRKRSAVSVTRNMLARSIHAVEAAARRCTQSASVSLFQSYSAKRYVGPQVTVLAVKMTGSLRKHDM